MPVNQFLPQLPSLGRPSWAPAGMSTETIADIQSRPDQLRRYRSGASRQINFTGSLLPQSPPAYDPASGAVTDNMGGPIGTHTPYSDSLADQAGRYTLHPIGDPQPSTPRPPGTPIDGPGGSNTVQQQTPWFSQPWGAASKEQELPFWMKGQRR